MQIIRSYFKNAFPKSQCTAHSRLPIVAPVALPNPYSVFPLLGLRPPKPEKGCVDSPVGSGSLVERVELAAEELVHGEHVDSALLEYCLELLVAADLALVGGLLQVVRLDVLPELFDNLGT